MTSLHQWKPWLPAVLMSLYLWASVPFMRTVATYLRKRHLLMSLIDFLGIGVAIFLTLSLAKHWRKLTGWQGVLFVGVLSVYAGLMRCWVQAPEEGVHVLQSGFLAYLFYRPLSQGDPRPCGSAWRACALAAAVVTFEETIQIFVPSRFFDWQDIGRGIVGSFLAWPLLHFIIADTRQAKT